MYFYGSPEKCLLWITTWLHFVVGFKLVILRRVTFLCMLTGTMIFKIFFYDGHLAPLKQNSDISFDLKSILALKEGMKIFLYYVGITLVSGKKP